MYLKKRKGTHQLLGCLLLISCLGCNKEQRWQNHENRARLELSGNWRIEYLKSAANEDRPAMDTTFSGPSAYYTLTIPATNDQTERTKCYGHLFTKFEFETQVITDSKLTNVTFDSYDVWHYTNDILYIYGTWDVDEYKPADFLSLSKHWWINGVRKENRINLRYILNK
jgi:hypothetical protein